MTDKILKLIFLTLLSLSSYGCSSIKVKPIAFTDSNNEYIGVWKHKSMQTKRFLFSKKLADVNILLKISEDGSFNYRKYVSATGNSYSIRDEGFIKKIGGNEIIVGMMIRLAPGVWEYEMSDIFDTQYEINRPPYKVRGNYFLEIDGYKLKKISL